MSAFNHCNQITTVTIPACSINKYAFIFCENLKTVFISEGVTRIPEYAFAHCRKLETVHFPESLEEIGESAFSKTGVTSVRFPEKLRLIDVDAFRASALVSVHLPQYSAPGSFRLSKILSEASNLQWPSPNFEVTCRIGEDAFAYCRSLTKVTGSKMLENLADALLLLVACFEETPAKKNYKPPLKTSEKPEIPETPSTSSERSGCYVATCVYGSYDCPEVWTLRRFRDEGLARTPWGRLFIRAYYAASPTLVRLFGSTAWFKRLCKPRLDRFVAKLRAHGVPDTPYRDSNQ